MTGLSADPGLVLAARLGLALLLLTAAWHKLRGLALFRATLAEYRLLPALLVRPAAILVTGLEIGIGFALLAGSDGRALLGAAGLLLLYGAAMGINVARGRVDIDCGCSGPAARQPLSGWLVLRNLLLAAVAVAAAGAVTERPLIWLDWLTVAGAVGVGALLYVAANQLIANAPQLESLR